MATKNNPSQLVLRRDTATGLTQVGWETDLPIGRFVHIDLVCELNDNQLPAFDSPHYTHYQHACLRARQANATMLEKQIQHHKALGWWPVPMKLFPGQQGLAADEFGNYFTAAMKLMFQLTHNAKQAWVVIHQDRVVHVRARRPAMELDELSYQVWYHQQLHQLAEYEGQLQEGNLVVCESGLWFKSHS